MKISHYLERLESSREYQKFLKENSDAYLMAGFFIMDLETKKTAHQINYFIPSKKKIAVFSLDPKVNVQILDVVGAAKPTQLNRETNIDLDALPGILEEEMKNRNITDEIKKIIAIVQNIDGKKIWNLNCVLSGMNILKAHVEDDSKTVLKMEKSSIIDYIQKIPIPQALQKGKKGKGVPGLPLAEGQPTPEELKEELKKLNKLEEAIEKEKEIIKSEVIKEEKQASVKKEKKAKAKKALKTE